MTNSLTAKTFSVYMRMMKNFKIFEKKEMKSISKAPFVVSSVYEKPILYTTLFSCYPLANFSCLMLFQIHSAYLYI